jgi:putative transposase
MANRHLHLSTADRDYLESLLRKGTLNARGFKRATGLLELDRGQTLQSVAAVLKVTYKTVAAWRDGYTDHGLQVLSDKPRRGRPIKIDGPQRAKITALACSDPPEGHARWSLRLLADKAIELNLAEDISHSQVGIILKKTNFNRT